jgi:hypothetical protein
MSTIISILILGFIRTIVAATILWPFAASSDNFRWLGWWDLLAVFVFVELILTLTSTKATSTALAVLALKDKILNEKRD